MLVHGERFRLHRCVVASRSAYFRRKLLEAGGKWRSKRRVTIVNPLVSVVAFRSVIGYIYTGRLEMSLDSASDCRLIAKQLSLTRLVHEIDTQCGQIGFARRDKGFRIRRVGVDVDRAGELQEDFRATLYQSFLNRATGDDYKLIDAIVNVGDSSFLCHKVREICFRVSARFSGSGLTQKWFKFRHFGAAAVSFSALYFAIAT